MTEFVDPSLPMLLAAAVAEFEAWMQGELLAVLPRASPIAVAAGSSPLPRD